MYGQEEDDVMSAYNPALQRAAAAQIEIDRKKAQPSLASKAAPTAGTILGAIVGGYFGGPAGAMKGASAGGAIGSGASQVINKVQGKEIPDNSVQGAQSIGSGLMGLKKLKDDYDTNRGY